jgi:ubiquinone biosynthesis accessory factor UbiJ
VNGLAGQMLERARGLLETIIERALATDDQALAGLAPLEGRLIAVQVSGADLRFLLAVTDGRLRILGESTRLPDLEVKASPSGLLAVVRALAAGEPMPPGALEMRGDLAVAQRFQRWAAGLEIDAEELLAGWFGDAPAHTLMRAGRAAREGLLSRSEAGLQALADYAVHEGGVLVGAVEVREFLDEVDLLRERQERLNARVARLATRLGLTLE